MTPPARASRPGPSPVVAVEESPRRSGCSASGRGPFVDPRTTRFHDPQLAAERAVFEDREEVGEARQNLLEGGITPESQNDDAAGVQRRESQDLAEIAIESNESSLLSTADVEDGLVRRASKLFLRDRRDIVTCGSKNITSRRPQVLVKLEPHPALADGTERICSRAASEP